MNRNVIHDDSCALAGEHDGESPTSVMPDGSRSLGAAPIVMMLPTFLGPLRMVIGNSNADQVKAR